MGRRLGGTPGTGLAGIGVDGPRPRERTCSPKEADVRRDDGRHAGDLLSPTLPWAARLAMRAPRRTVLACRVPPIESRVNRRSGTSGITGTPTAS